MIRNYSGADALKNARENAFSRWGAPFGDRERALDPDWASTRLATDVFRTAIKPSFRLKRGDLIYASGSCFAQNIELNLLQSGMQLLYDPAFFAQSPEFADLATNAVRTTLTMYNTPSIMRFAHMARKEVDDRLIYEVKPGAFVDCAVGALPPMPKETLMARRKRMKDQLSRLPDCACIIFTLGLSEVWYDSVAQDYLNYLPDIRLIRQNPERFELHVLDYQQTYDHLAAGIEALHALGLRNILLTVSPVPLLATFTDQDIIVANEYSKSVLHAAAQAICAHMDCDYFPSYELVRYAPAGMAWEHDRRHPTSNLIGQVTRLFAESYIDAS